MTYDNLKAAADPLNEKDRQELLRALYESNPAPRSELNFSNPFELLCAVVLSAQTTDAAVNAAAPALFALAPDARHLRELSEERIGEKIRRVGLWRSKARYLKGLGEMLCAEHDGQVPRTLEELVKLPGVGPKTARVVLNVAFGQPEIAVDTHIFRVCNRTGLCPGKSVRAVEKRLPSLIPERYRLPAHHLLLLHGRHVCRARLPRCADCVIARWCRSGVPAAALKIN